MYSVLTVPTSPPQSLLERSEGRVPKPRYSPASPGEAGVGETTETWRGLDTPAENAGYSTSFFNTLLRQYYYPSSQESNFMRFYKHIHRKNIFMN
jgi:hypothetical protein